MRIVGLMVTRNEEWVLNLSLRAALRWCDAVVVVDHMSTDDSRNIIRQVTHEVGEERLIFSNWEDTSKWDEMDMRQHSLDLGRRVGGEVFAIIDSDEVPCAYLLPKLRGFCDALKPKQLLDLPLIPIWGSLNVYRVDPIGMWQRSWITLAWRDDGTQFWKAKEDGYQYHNRPPYGTETAEIYRSRPIGSHMMGGVMHLQFASLKRLHAKHALYKMDEVLRWPGRESNAVIDKKYSHATDEKGIAVKWCPTSWWEGYDKGAVNLFHVPWQEAECKRLLSKHGVEKFRGLDLYGLTQPKGPD